jgi:hypothetical protein
MSILGIATLLSAVSRVLVNSRLPALSETHQDAQCEMKSHPRVFADKGFFQTSIRRGCLKHFMQQSPSARG